MKLWAKISLVCTAVLLIIVAACSALLLTYAKRSILALTIEHAKEKQYALQASFTEMANYYLPERAGEAAAFSLVDHCFQRFADGEGVLMQNGETIYSQVNINPETLLPLYMDEEEQRVLQAEVQGRNVLIVGHYAYVYAQPYQIYIVQDISTVYNTINSLIQRFALIALASLLIGALLIILLTRHASKPLVKLSETSKQIADGEYARRAEVHTKDEAGQLAVDFNRMAQAVQQHIEQLTETMERQQLFIGGVTHEFKTPMTSLLLHADTLMHTDLAAQEARQSLAHIYGQTQWLERLTQKLLKLLTLREQLACKPTPVRAVLDAAQESTVELLAQRGISLHVRCEGEEALLPMDSDLMQSLLVNLIDNAAKASEPGQSILLCAYGNVIEVADEGSGIPAAEIGRVTEPFYMVDGSRSKRKGGSGLGLALAGQIAQAHGAKLIIKSELGSGTTVQVIF